MTTYRARVPKGLSGSKSQAYVIASFDLLPRSNGAIPAEVKLREALAIVDESVGQKNDLPKALDRRVLVMDRRVIWTTPIKVNGTLVFWELLDVVHLQAELAAHDVPLRGAVAIGDVQMRPGFAVGRGLELANQLRDEVAVVPRVVVPPTVMVEAESNPLLRAPHHTPMDDLGYIKSLLRLDADGIWFVDYLAVHCREATNARHYLEGHRRLIERRLDASVDLDGESRAWTWLWSYHNSVVDDLRNEGRISDDAYQAVRIPAKSNLVYAFPPDAKIPI